MPAPTWGDGAAPGQHRARHLGGKMNQFSRQHVGKPMATVFTEYKTNAEGKLRARSEVINVATIQTAPATSSASPGGSLPEPRSSPCCCGPGPSPAAEILEGAQQARPWVCRTSRRASPPWRSAWRA